MFGSFLPSLWSSSNQSLLGSRSRHCYAIKWKSPRHNCTTIVQQGAVLHRSKPSPQLSVGSSLTKTLIILTALVRLLWIIFRVLFSPQTVPVQFPLTRH